MSSSSTRIRTLEGTGAGSWLAEEALEEMLAVTTDFLTPNRESRGGPR